MNHRQATKTITELFGSAFNRTRYEQFLYAFLNEYRKREKHYSGNCVPDAFKSHVRQYWRIGKYVDPHDEEMDLLIVQVKSARQLEAARFALRNFAINRLKQFEKNASLVCFYANDDGGADWRFSFIKFEYTAHKDENDKVKLKRELTPARRYSYLVGAHENSHTAGRQLLPLLEEDDRNPSIADIEAVFSIEKVTDEFFQQYKALFHNLAEHLSQQPHFKDGPAAKRKQEVARFAKKLLGQIVFLYFLQKKGWLGVAKDERWGKGSRRFLRDRFEQVAEINGSYYLDFLQYLFYEALADDRKRQSDPSYYPRFGCRIPFLNGGLFEASYDWKSNLVNLPNDLFSNGDVAKTGDIGTGILDVFDRYNFTVKEDEPLEREVAVDPEMLGKVFENMLETSERRSVGAFYTPREIVHYMCQESLIHYLCNSLIRRGVQGKGEEQARASKDDIEELVRKGRLALENDARILSNGGEETEEYKFQLPKSVRQHAKTLDTALADIKVCDPAIGSGAFPVGLLHEIVNARLALAPHIAGRAGSRAYSAYALKRHAISESIYGVDIDNSAIDIARLRLWLSLMVDEDDLSEIKPLPNLDYKIQWGDSLIGFPQDWNSLAFERIEEMKNEFFGETDHDQKEHLKKQINARVQEKLDRSGEIVGYPVEFDFRLMFSEIWHRGDDKNGGFDIVIGNPPYIQIQNFSGKPIQEYWSKQGYQSFDRTADVYCLFYEKGYRVLREKGVLAFITSNKWMRAAYGKKLRQFFVNEAQPLAIIDFSSYQVFRSATVDTNVLLLCKEKHGVPVRACRVDTSFTRYTSLGEFVEKAFIDLRYFSSDSWIISTSAEHEIRRQIETVGVPLADWDISINRGLITGFNEAFIIDGEKKAELIASDPKSAEVIKPILRGRDIKRYCTSFANLWLINTHNGFKDIPPVDIEDYPAIKSYLDSFGGKLKDRADKGQTPYNLRSCAYLDEFEKEKIVWGNLALRCQFAVADDGVYISAPSPLIGGGSRYLLAVLNSEVGDYYIRSLGISRSGGYFEYKPMFVKLFPVPQLGAVEREPFETLSNYALLAVKNNLKDQSIFLDETINALVYELYFSEEIKAAGVEILSKIGKLTPFTDKMSEKKKSAIITREYDRLTDSAHPLQGQLKALNQVEVVRIIRKTLKR